MRTIDEFTMVNDTINALEGARKALQGMRCPRCGVLSGEEERKVAYAVSSLEGLITSLRTKNCVLYNRLLDLEGEE